MSDVKNSLRVAKVDSFYSLTNYLVAVVENGSVYTDTELEALDLYRQYLRQRFYTPSEIRDMDKGDVDICVGNGTTFAKREDGSWSYRHWTWQGLQVWPAVNSDAIYRYQDVNDLISNIEKLTPKWEQFKAKHS